MPTRLQRIEFGNEDGFAVQANRISPEKPARKNAIGLLPNRDWGQRTAHQYRMIPKIMTDRVKLRKSGSWTVCIMTKMMGHIAKMNRRCSGMKVISPKMNASMRGKTESEIKKRMPKPNAASMTTLPT